MMFTLADKLRKVDKNSFIQELNTKVSKDGISCDLPTPKQALMELCFGTYEKCWAGADNNSLIQINSLFGLLMKN